VRRHRYRTIRFGVETLTRALVLPRHRHTAGYATVVLNGSFVEASFAGRAEARAGDVLLHGRFDCHANWAVGQPGLRILRLPWLDDDLEGHFRVADPDALARIAERDPFAASQALRAALIAPAPHALDWPEKLAGALSQDPSLLLGAWARQAGLAPETISRGFRGAFGVSPKLFRLEVRARRAWNAVVRSNRSLTTIAHELAFADLAHMSRSVAILTGSPPRAWRQVHSSCARADRSSSGA
jgi:AraC-like DNA-binding protein